MTSAFRERWRNRLALHATAFSPDFNLFATKTTENIKVWDAQTLQEMLTLLDVSTGRGPAFSPDGHQLACSGPKGTVKIYDATALPEKP